MRQTLTRVRHALRPTLLGLAVLVLTACARAPQPVKQESYVFGTRVEITAYDTDRGRAERAVAAALADLDALHNRLHAWKAGSEVVALNAAIARGQPYTVSADLAGLLRQSARYEALSDGLFSPAVGRLVALWGFHADTFAPVTPDATELARVVASRPRMADLTLDGKQVSSRNRDVAIDLGGIAKGWALDRVRASLKAAGVASALVNIGGNVIALGAKPDGSAWRVGIQHPRRNEAQAVVALADGEAIGTSGDYQRFFESGGKRHCHLIDPRDGSADCRMQSATVLVDAGPDAGLRSDATSKPLYLAGVDGAARYARAQSVDKVLLFDGRGEAWISPRLAARLEWLDQPPRIHTLE